MDVIGQSGKGLIRCHGRDSNQHYTTLPNQYYTFLVIVKAGSSQPSEGQAIRGVSANGLSGH